MATFGTLPGVQVTATGGAVTGVTIGRSQYLVLIGHGDNTAGSASTNTAVQISSRSDADTKFGSGTDLARAYRDARANGANPTFIYGVMAANTSTTESFATVSSGTLANAPIIDEADRVSAQDTGAGVSVTVNFVYESTVPTPSDSNTINLNPITGDWVADASSSYDISYAYSDWSGAITAAKDVISEEQFGILSPLSNAESVASTLTTALDDMRSSYKMALGLMAAQPNATTDDYKPKYDTANYTDNLDNDALFLVAPTTEASSDTSILGAVAGRFAGSDISDPVHHEPIEGVDNLDQKLPSTDADDLRSSQVIPLRDKGTPRLHGNISTSTATGWERDFWRRRIVDVSIVTAKAIGDRALGRINDSETRTTTQTLIRSELLDLVSEGLIKPNTGQEENLYVDVYQIDKDTIGIDLGITPYGVVKSVEVSLTVQT